MNEIAYENLRKLTLWCLKEPEKLNKGLIEELKKMVSSWNYRKLMESKKKFTVAPSTLKEKDLHELKEIVGSENVSISNEDRIFYSHGGAAEDIVRMRLGLFSKLAEAVVFPKNETEIFCLYSFCENKKLSLIPVGGRTSVTRALHFEKTGIAVVLTKHFNNVLSLEEENMTITVQSGIKGPELESYLNKKGFTLHHFPQSFAESTVGGWIASRSAGQNSTLFGKIEDMVMALKVITPTGSITSPKSPAYATGPFYFPYFIGSEGTLGIITEATLRIHPYKPNNRKFSAYMFPSFEKGVEALKKIGQSMFLPAVARLSDGLETQSYLLLDREGKMSLKDKIIEFFLKLLKLHPKKRCVMLLVFEGDRKYIKKGLKNARKQAKQNKGLYIGEKYGYKWFKDRFEHPHLRDIFIDHSLITDTLETATTWDNILRLHKETRKALDPHSQLVFAHLSHIYREGSAIYFTYFSPLDKEKPIEQLRSMQTVALEQFKKNSGVTSHHHGVGKAFRKWAKEEWGENSLKMAQGIKDKLDPKHILNPGNFPD